MKRKLWLSVAALAIGGSLLVAGAFAGSASSGTVKAGKTGGVMRVNLSNTDFDYLDPALAYAQWSWQFTYLTNYKLLNFPDKAAPEGSKLQPEASAAAGAKPSPARLSDAHATMAEWLGVSIPNRSGRPIAAILG